MRTRQQTRLLEEGSGVGESEVAIEPVALDEEGGTSISTGGEISQRKRRAPPKIPESSSVKKRKWIKGKLSGVLSLPIEVFIEIMKYLALPEVLSLSRSNKFFRHMLMTRSATTLEIWKSAVENVPGLPACPAGLCEPQYAALIYTKHCSMCGTRIVKDMDPYLNVRICKDCIEIHVIHLDDIDDDLRSLVPRSKVTRMKASRYGARTCLIRDVRKANEWDDNITALGRVSREEMDAKLDERLNEILDRVEYAKEMEEFLRCMAEARTQEIGQLKEQRRQDIRRRLVDAGWEERDWIFPEFVARKWASLVEAPQALTDRAWQKLYSQMVPYLEKNRESYTQYLLHVRRGKRLRRMRRLLLGVRNQNYLFDINAEDPAEDEREPRTDRTYAAEPSSPANNTPSLSENESNDITEEESEIDMEKLNSSASIASSIKVKIPFPPMVDLLKWPIISDLLEADTDAATLEERFEELRDDIEDQIRSWGSQVEDELVDLVKTGSESGTDQSYNMPRLRLQTTNAMPSYTTPTARLLLRADSVFRIREDDALAAPMPLYFPEIFSALQARPTGYCTPAFKLNGDENTKYGYTWSSREVEYYVEGSIAAKALLKQLGRQDAAQFELQALGTRFTCGSCGDPWPRSWNEMVQHYAEAIVHANMAVKANSSFRKQVKYNTMHSLNFKAKDKPLLLLHSTEEAKILTSRRRKFEKLVRCKICKELDIDFQEPRDVMLKHFRTVHAIKAPKAAHYERTRSVQGHIPVRDRTGKVSESTSATNQEWVKRIMANHLHHGPQVLWSDYGHYSYAWRWRAFFDKDMHNP